MLSLPDLVRERAARIAEEGPGYGGHDPVYDPGAPDDLRDLQMPLADLVQADLAWAVLGAIAPLVETDALAHALETAAARLRSAAGTPRFGEADRMHIALACQALARDVRVARSPGNDAG